MKQKRNLWIGVAGALALACSSVAHATPTLLLTDGTVANTVTITDNGGCVTGVGFAGTCLADVNPESGVVTSSISGLGNFVVNITSGEASPPFAPGGVGLPNPPHFHLNSIDTHSGAGTDTLYILFSDTGININVQGMAMSIGPSVPTGTTMTYDAYFDQGNSGNNLFGRTTAAPGTAPHGADGTAVQIGQLGPFVGPTVLGGGVNGPGPSGTPYSLTQLIKITATGTSTSSFDADLQATPEPASILFLGSMLFIGSKLFRKKLGTPSQS